MVDEKEKFSSLASHFTIQALGEFQGKGSGHPSFLTVAINCGQISNTSDATRLLELADNSRLQFFCFCHIGAQQHNKALSASLIADALLSLQLMNNSGVTGWKIISTHL